MLLVAGESRRLKFRATESKSGRFERCVGEEISIDRYSVYVSDICCC